MSVGVGHEGAVLLELTLGALRPPVWAVAAYTWCCCSCLREEDKRSSVAFIFSPWRDVYGCGERLFQCLGVLSLALCGASGLQLSGLSGADPACGQVSDLL